MADSFLTIADVAQLAGVSHSTLRAYLAREQMPAVSGHIGRTPYWLPAAIQPWLDARAQARTIAGATGSRGATVTVQRRTSSGELLTVAQATWEREQQP